MKVSDQLDAPADLPPRKGPAVPIEYVCGWTQNLSRNVGEEK